MPKELADELADVLENFDEEEVKDETTDEEESAETSDAVGEVEGEESDEPSELELLKAQLAEKDKVIADIAKGVKPAEYESAEVQGFQLQETEWEDNDFVGEDFDLDALTHEQFNSLLNKAAAAGAQRGAEVGAKQVLMSIPGIVKHNINVETSIQSAVKEFYSDNKDLTKFKGAVSAVTQELASSNPDWELTKLFDEAGKETRKRLGIKKSATKSKTKTPSTVRPRGQRGRGKGDQLSGLEAEISNMMELG